MYRMGTLVAVDDRFSVESLDTDVLQRSGLLERGILHFANGLADLYLNQQLPENEKEVYRRAFNWLMSEHGRELYSLLVEEHCPNISTNLWKCLAKDFRMTIGAGNALTDMPTEVLEEIGKEVWLRLVRVISYGAAKKEVGKAIAARSDIYGAHSLPTEIACGILFDGGEG